MDIQRPDLKHKRRKRIAVVAAALITSSSAGVYGISRMKPALPSVDRSAVWMDTVKRGPMVRQVRGIGTLVPREDRLRLIPAETDATVLRIDILPGAEVNPNSVLMELARAESFHIPGNELSALAWSSFAHIRSDGSTLFLRGWNQRPIDCCKTSLDPVNPVFSLDRPPRKVHEAVVPGPLAYWPVKTGCSRSFPSFTLREKSKQIFPSSRVVPAIMFPLVSWRPNR